MLMLLSAALGGCGGGSGGGDGTSPADPLFVAYSAAVAGDFRGPFADGPGIDTGAPERICYRQLPVDRASAEHSVAQDGGVITEASASRWCAQLPGGSLCLVALEGEGFALDDRSVPGSPAIDVGLVVPLANGRLVQFRSETALLGSQALRDLEMGAMVPADDFPAGASCQSVPDGYSGPADLDGEWAGYRVAYAPLSQTGTATSASMMCEGNTCTFSDTDDGALPFASQGLGHWTLAAAGLDGRILSSNDGAALAVWLCDDGLTGMESHPFAEGCQLYGFNRLMPG